MTFLQLQTELAEMHMDTTTTYAVWGTKNKACLNKAYEFLYDQLKNAERIKRKIANVTKTSVTIADYVGTLPADFGNMDVVSVSPIADYSDAYDLSPDIYYDWKVTGLGTATSPYNILLEDNITPIYVRYMPVRADMSLDADEPVLPTEIHRSIVDFALVEYYRRIRDSIETANALSLANQYLSERLAKLA